MDTLKQSLSSKPTITWSGSPAIKQNFSLLETIIFYITKNPTTPKCYLKLAKSCKYFFEKHPILVVTCIHSATSICSNHSEECINMNFKCCINVDVNKIRTKIWLTQKYILYDSRCNSSLILPKLFKSENATLALYIHSMGLNEFQLWAPAFQNFEVYDFTITDIDENAVTLDKILETIPNVKTFEQSASSYWSPSIMKNMQLNNLENLEKIALYDIDQNFAIEDIEAFITKHKETKIILDFYYNTSEEYIIQLDQLIDKIITSKIHNCLISYKDQNYEKHMAMNKLFNA